VFYLPSHRRLMTYSARRTWRKRSAWDLNLSPAFGSLLSGYTPADQALLASQTSATPPAPPAPAPESQSPAPVATAAQQPATPPAGTSTAPPGGSLSPEGEPTSPDPSAGAVPSATDGSVDPVRAEDASPSDLILDMKRPVAQEAEDEFGPIPPPEQVKRSNAPPAWGQPRKTTPFNYDPLRPTRFGPLGLKSVLKRTSSPFLRLGLPFLLGRDQLRNQLPDPLGRKGLEYRGKPMASGAGKTQL